MDFEWDLVCQEPKKRAPKSRLAKTKQKKRKMKVPYKIGLDKCSMVFLAKSLASSNFLLYSIL